MLSCEFGNSGIALLSNEDNDSEVLSIGGDSFPEISFVASIKEKKKAPEVFFLWQDYLEKEEQKMTHQQGQLNQFDQTVDVLSSNIKASACLR